MTRGVRPMLLAVVLLVGVLAATLVAALGGTVPAVSLAAGCTPAASDASAGPSDPGGPAYVQDYLGAAQRFGLGDEGYAFLASINYYESDFGQSAEPGVRSGENPAGAAGPMQMGNVPGGASGDSWDADKVTGVPGGAVPLSVYDEADAVYAAANYLKRAGAPDWGKAVLSYNHAEWYVAEVTTRAQTYLGADGLSSLAADLRSAGGGTGATAAQFISLDAASTQATGTTDVTTATAATSTSTASTQGGCCPGATATGSDFAAEGTAIGAGSPVGAHGYRLPDGSVIPVRRMPDGGLQQVVSGPNWAAQIDHVYPEYVALSGGDLPPGGPNITLPADVVAALFQSAGRTLGDDMPGETMEEISEHESGGLHPGIVQNTPNTYERGYGLAQMTDFTLGGTGETDTRAGVLTPFGWHFLPNMLNPLEQALADTQLAFGSPGSSVLGNWGPDAPYVTSGFSADYTGTLPMANLLSVLKQDGNDTTFVSDTTPTGTTTAGAATPAICTCPTATAVTGATPPGVPIDENGGEGFTPDPGTNFTVNLEPNIAERLDLLGKRLHLAIYGISGYRSPDHSVEVGGFADDPHTRGAAADIAVDADTKVSAAQITDQQLASVGLTRPFDASDAPGNAEVNHVQIINPDGSLLDIDVQPPIATPAQAPATPTPIPPPIPGAASGTVAVSNAVTVPAGAPVSTTATTATTTTSTTTSTSTTVSESCGSDVVGSGPEPVTPGDVAVIEPDGTAAAPANAPQVVKQMIWAGDRIDHENYSFGGGHGDPAQTMSQTDPDPGAVPGDEENGGPGYDCSSSTSYVLWGGGFGQSLLNGSVYDSQEFTTAGDPGSGKWVTWYAQDGTHVYIEVAGIYLDTAAGEGQPPNPPTHGPRWVDHGTGPAGFVRRHPPGL